MRSLNTLLLNTLLVVFSLMHLYAQPENAAFRNLTSAEGLPTTSVTDVAQDAFGFIWIGSWDYVYKYDGNTYTKIPSTQEGRYLEADKKGRVWISFEKSVGYYDPYADSINKYDIDYSGRYPVIGVDDSNGVWVASDYGVLKFDYSANRFIKDPEQQRDYVYGITAYGNGELLFVLRKNVNGSAQYLIGRRTSDGKYNYEPFPEDLNNPQKGKLFSDKKNDQLFLRSFNSTDIVIINSFGWAYKTEKEATWIFKKPLNKNFSLNASDSRIDNDGNIWLNQENRLSRVNIYTGSIISYNHDPKNPNSILPSNNIFAGSNMFLDRQGILWISRFSQGISRLNLYENNFGLLKDSTGSPIPDVLSALESKDGSFWIGKRNLNGLIHFNSDGKIIKTYNSDSENSTSSKNSPPGKSISTKLSHPFAWAMATTSDGSVWVGGGSPGPHMGGLSRIHPETDKITRFKNDPNDPNSITGDWVFKILVDGSDRVWLSPYNYPDSAGGICFVNPKTEKVTRGIKDPVSGLIDNNSYNLELVTSKGDIIIGTQSFDTTYIVDHNTLTKKTFGPQIPSGQRWLYVHQDYENKIWFISNNSFGYLDSTFEKVEYLFKIKKNDFPANEISALNSDNSGLIWLATDNGIIEFDPIIEKFKHFGFERGLQGNYFSYNVNYQGPSGKIYFAGNGGINIFDPEAIKTNPYPPEMVFTGLKLDGKSITFGEDSAVKKPIFESDKITIEPDVLTISIDFSAIHFAGFKSNQYKYKLEGFDKDWRDGSTNGNATYTNLSPGEYTFYIKGSNWDGVWSDGNKSITIVVLPPWWRTWWAYSVYGLLFLILLWRIDKYQKARTIKREMEKAQKRELEQAKEIEKAYKELKSTQAQLIHAEKMASLGALTAGIAHEIKNPLNFVSNFSEVSRELLDEMKAELQNGNSKEVMEIGEDLKLNLEKIIQHGKRADSIVKGMLLHSRGTSGEKSLTDINDLLDQYVTLAYHGLRAQDKDFNITIDKDYDNSIEKINVVPQDMSRVFLNLVNNACYSADEKKRMNGNDFVPLLKVSTKNLNNRVEIRIKDNGNGIPVTVRKNIFNPFFTTKPTGEGTGLGLSLSYDIVTKIHGGDIKFETKEGEFTEFIISLPKTK